MAPPLEVIRAASSGLWQGEGEPGSAATQASGATAADATAPVWALVCRLCHERELAAGPNDSDATAAVADVGCVQGVALEHAADGGGASMLCVDVGQSKLRDDTAASGNSQRPEHTCRQREAR